MSVSKTLKGSKTGVIAMCERAKKLEDSGEYIRATQALGKWWQGIGIRPEMGDQLASKGAAILSRVGALSGWLGSMQQVPGSQEKAKDLISEGANLFESIGFQQDWAEARSDLAICYWREGAFGEARIILRHVLECEVKFPPELKAKILLRLVTVETSTKHFEMASTLLDQVASLIANKESALLLGKFYFYRAFTLHCQGEDQNNSDLLRSAVHDYHEAVLHYKKARHYRYVAVCENNIGNAYRILKDFPNTHSHLDEALRMYDELKDKGRAARVYDNKAWAFIAEGNLPDAELAALTSVKMLRKGDEYATLAESLTTLGVVLSRGENIDEAIRTFTDAKEIALNVGDMESAGNAVLTQLEELQANLTSIVVRSLYLEADELLKNSPKKSTISRLQSIARKQFETGNPELVLKREKYFNWKNFSLPEAVHSYERALILKALNEAGGRITKAAGLLGVSHQSLSQIMHKRHKDLQQYSVQRKRRSGLKAKNH